MLGSMRDRSGGPSPAFKVLAVLLALALAGPLTLLMINGMLRILGLTG